MTEELRQIPTPVRSQAAWFIENLTPEVNARLEWVWMWIRIPTVLVGAVGAGFIFRGAPQLPLVYIMAAVVMVYSAGLFVLLRRNFVATAFVVGMVADSVGLMVTWWIILHIPRVGDTPTDLYLILFPLLVAGVIRLGPMLGAAYALVWIGWLAIAAWVYHGPDSYAAEEFPVRVLFLVITTVLTSAHVSKIKSGRSQLAASEGRFRSIFEAAPAGVALLDGDRRAFAVNDALTAMLMLPRHEVLGHRLSEFEGDEPAHRPGANFKMLLSGEINRVELERRLLRGDGSFMWVNAITSAVRDATGGFLYAVRIIDDITERKHIEFAKDELMALTSHELKTPLTSIHAALGLADNGALGELPEKARPMIHVAAQNSDRLVSLVQDILDLEGMRLGKTPMDMTPCDAFDLLQTTANLLLPTADEHGIPLVVEAQPIEVFCSRDKVMQVLTNLVGNALKFSQDGRDCAIVLACTTSATEATFEVRDCGPGIPPDQQRAIFDRFHQVDNAATRTTGGTGLGLAIAKAIVEGHGGRIWVESAPDSGSSFKFTLPLSQTALPQHA